MLALIFLWQIFHKQATCQQKTIPGIFKLVEVTVNRRGLVPDLFPGFWSSYYHKEDLDEISDNKGEKGIDSNKVKPFFTWWSLD